MREERERVALPKLGLVILIRYYHGLSHTSSKKLTNAINQFYYIADVKKTNKFDFQLMSNLCKSEPASKNKKMCCHTPRHLVNMIRLISHACRRLEI